MKQTQTTKTTARVWALVLVLSLGVGIFAGINLIKEQGDYNRSKDEYTTLRQLAPDASPASMQTPASALPEKSLSEINPDYIGWLRVQGTAIDYPLVQGRDNDKYLHTSFEEQQNPLGAIFMDARCKNGFDAPYVILYGHNAKNSTMFGGLKNYLDPDFLKQNGQISITLPCGETKQYRIFAARKSNIADIAYQWETQQADPADFLKALDAPEGATQVLVLSTCANSSDKDERVLVFAVPG